MADHRSRVAQGLHFVQLTERLKDLLYMSKVRQKIASDKVWMVG